MITEERSKDDLLRELEQLRHDLDSLGRLYSKTTESYKITENALLDSQENYKLLLDLAPDAFFQGDEKGSVIMANKNASILTGYTNKELMTMNLRSLFSESSISNRPLRYDLLEQGLILTTEREIVRKDGVRIIVEMTSRKMPNNTYQSFMRDISEKRRAEQALRDSEFFYRTIFENTGTALMMIEEDTTISLVNSEFVTLSGYSREEIEGILKWPTFVTNDDLDRMMAYHKQRRKNNSSAPASYEFRFKRRNGEIRNIIIFIAIIPETKRSIGSLIDITDRVKIEEDLCQSEEKFRAIVETSPDAIVISTLTGDVLFLTDKTASLWGYDSIGDITGRNILEFVHPTYHKKADFLINEMLNGNLTGAAEYLMVRKDGSHFYCDSNANIIRDTKNQPTGILFINRDITQRKLEEKELIRAKEAAEESEERYRLFIEQTTDGVFRMEFDEPFDINLPLEEMVDFIYDHAIVVECNMALLKMYGTDDRRDIIGKRQIDFHGGRDNPVNRESIRRFIKNDFRIQQEETEELDKQGNLHYFANTSVGIFKNGNLVRIWGTQSDVTEKKKYEIELIKAKEKAEESDRLKSAFLANMSHEIRTPMNGILGFADLLKEPQLTGEQQQEYINIIEKSGVRMLNIINDIIDISKIESGAMKILYSETNINEQIEYIHTFFNPEAERKGLSLYIKSLLPADEAIVKTDREKIYAILTNLIKNAIKFTDSGSIEFGCVNKGDNLEFFVKDTGIGIPEDRHNAVFERFIQADISDKRALQGAGLGLAITKAFVEMLGGEIWFRSKENEGTHFFFTIPHLIQGSAGNAKKTRKEANSVKDLNNLKVLIVEDDSTSDKHITLLLNKYNCKVFHAADGIEAVEFCRKTPDIDLILMDIRLPGMNGYEAAMEIRKFNENVVIIAQTAHALAGDKERALESGCNNYLTKPINKALLNVFIEKYFSRQ